MTHCSTMQYGLIVYDGQFNTCFAVLKVMNNPKHCNKKISIILPCFNEGDTIHSFRASALPKFKEGLPAYNLEFIIVDDGSTDNTLMASEAWAAEDSRVRVISLSRNFGKEAAITAGLDAASGEAVIPMDIDLQDPPEIVLEFVERWEGGADTVIGVRSDRSEDGFLKRVTAEGFYKLFNRLSRTKLPFNGGDFRLLDRAVVDAIRAMPERDRFMKGIFAWVGFKTEYVYYSRPARSVGESKFNAGKLLLLAWEGVVNFSGLPLRIWTFLGFGVAAFSFIYALYIILDTLINGIDAPGYASLMVVVLLSLSINMVMVGLLGEYIVRIFNETKARPIYVVKKYINANDDHK